MCVLYYILTPFITGDTGSVQQNYADDIVGLNKPSVSQSEAVINKLIKE